ncbi:MAG: hypothetical protein HY042_09065 [Spirochaetia bacterium]|nr:hypothetical protein [Spirochaetia bacterium]
MARRKRTAERAEQIRHESALDPFRDFQGSTAELFIAKFFYFLRSHLRETLYGLGALLIAGALVVSWLVWDTMRRAIADAVSSPEMKALFYYRAGILYEKSKNWAGGAAAFGRAADQITDWNAQKAQATFGKVRCLQESGKDQEAKDTARKLLEAKEGEGLDEVKLAVTAHMLARSR